MTIPGESVSGVEPVRVVIADDHPVFRSGLHAMLDVEDGLEVVGEANAGIEIVAMVRHVQPDLVLMDLNMPELDGVGATRQILHESSHVRILVLTMFDDDDSVFAAMRAGAHGYLLKGANHAEVRHAVHVVAAGGAMFGPVIAQRVIEFFARPRPAGVAVAGRRSGASDRAGTRGRTRHALTSPAMPVATTGHCGVPRTSCRLGGRTGLAVGSVPRDGHRAHTMIARVNVRRRDRLGGTLDKYEHAAWPAPTRISASAASGSPCGTREAVRGWMTVAVQPGRPYPRRTYGHHS